jgi:hypothetical protein
LADSRVYVADELYDRMPERELTSEKPEFRPVMEPT